MPPPQRKSPTPQLDALIAANPDLVDRIFDYLLELYPQLSGRPLEEAKRHVRGEFSGAQAYIRSEARDARAREVLALFNGRNASEVARRLGVSRASVYRYIKQPGHQAVSVFPVIETRPPVASGLTPTTSSEYPAMPTK